MSNEPIGRFDHIGIAVHSIEKALPFFEGALGAPRRRHGRFRWRRLSGGDPRLARFLH